MTGASSDNIYPQYCFHLSPTIDRWCPLRAQDIHTLGSHPGFEGSTDAMTVTWGWSTHAKNIIELGQDLWFYLNHPIKWVRVAGVVVAIDEYAGCRVYTLDDSSGATIECRVNIPQADKGLVTTGKAAQDTAQAIHTTAIAEAQESNIDGDIDVGDVLDVKGSVRRFWDSRRQIRVEKVIHLRCTEHEARFWGKLAQFRKDVLSRPWLLEEKQIRRCRREAEGRYLTADERRQKKRKAIETGIMASRPEKAIGMWGSGGSNHSNHGNEKSNNKKQEEEKTNTGTGAKARTTGLEKKSKRAKTAITVVEGEYRALGI